jgi:hypothetical protein
MIIYIGLYIFLFINLDIILTKYNIKGIFYFNHIITNIVVTYNTFNSMLDSYKISNFIINNNIIECLITDKQIISLYHAKYIIYSLHIYHILWYFTKLKKDDWIHHILMIGIVLPLTEIIPQNQIISHGLFYIIGLPGLIRNTLIFLNKNNIINRLLVKKYDAYINLWLRAPGCIMNTTISIIGIIYKYNELTYYQLYSGIIMLSLVYWNGIYILNQVLNNYYKYNNILSK